MSNYTTFIYYGNLYIQNRIEFENLVKSSLHWYSLGLDFVSKHKSK